MNAFGPTQSLSLVELIIYGFIAANMLLSGAYLIQRSFAKRADAPGE